MYAVAAKSKGSAMLVSAVNETGMMITGFFVCRTIFTQSSTRVALLGHAGM